MYGIMPTDPDSTVRSDLAWSGLGSVLTLVATVGMTMVLTRGHSPAVVAAVSSAAGLVMILAPLVTLGLPAAVVPLVARSPADRRGPMARRVLRLTVALAGGAGVVAAGVVLVAVDGGRRGVFLAMLCSLPAVALAAVTEGAARSVGRFGVAFWLLDWSRRLLLIGALAASAVATVSVAGWLAVAVAAHTVLVAALVILLPRRVLRSAEVHHTVPSREVLRVSAHFVPMAMFGQIVPQAGVLIVDAMAGDVEVGKVAVGIRAYAAVSVLFVVATRVVAPRVAGAGSMASLGPWLRRMSARLTLVSAVLTGVIVAGGPWLTGGLFGGQYRGAWLPAALFALSVVVQAGTGFGGMVLAQRGGQRLMAGVSLLSVAAFVLAAVPAARAGGATGVAIVGVVVMLVRGVVTTVVAQRRERVLLWPGLPWRAPAEQVDGHHQQQG